MTVSGISSYLMLSGVILGLIAIVAGIFLWRSLNEAKKRGLAFTIAVIAVIFSAAWLVESSSIIYFSQAKTCVYCHEMKPEYNTKLKSRHANINCLACHLPKGGPFTLLTEDVKNTKEVWDHFTGNYPKIINKDSHVSKEMKSDVCERCHNMFTKRQIAIRTEIKMNHPDHLRLGITCQTCHNRITHLGARGYPYFNGLTMMQGCMRCHTPGRAKTIKGHTAPSSCRTCHRQANWGQKVFGKSKISASDFENCRACHRRRNPRVVKEFQLSVMAKNDIDCPDCHNTHQQKFNPKPSAKLCGECHHNAAKDVISGKMGFKGYKPPFKKVADVDCIFCHRPHIFKPVKRRS